MTHGLGDEALVAALRQAIRARQAVPPEFVEAAKSAFTWRSIDTDLAQLTYDSAQAPAAAAPMRAEAASVRALTFTSPRLTIELDVAEDLLLGHIVPAQAAVIGVQTREGTESAAPSDEIGRFSVHPVPHGPFRLHCRTSGIDVLTGWITL